MSLNPPKVTREEAIRNAGRVFADIFDRLDELPARQAAQEAHRRGGPSIDELEARILASREGTS